MARRTTDQSESLLSTGVMEMDFCKLVTLFFLYALKYGLSHVPLAVIEAWTIQKNQRLNSQHEMKIINYTPKIGGHVSKRQISSRNCQR
jgi:hypothetical protein